MLRRRLVNDERRPPIGVCDDIGRNMDMSDDGLVIIIDDQLVGNVIHDDDEGWLDDDRNEESSALADCCWLDDRGDDADAAADGADEPLWAANAAWINAW